MATLTDLRSPSELNTALKSPGLVMLDIYTRACVICRRVEPMVAAVAEGSGGALSAYKLDAEQLIDFAAQHDVRGVPTLLLFRDGNLVDRRSGFLTASALREWVGSQP